MEQISKYKVKNYNFYNYLPGISARINYILKDSLNDWINYYYLHHDKSNNKIELINKKNLEKIKGVYLKYSIQSNKNENKIIKIDELMNNPINIDKILGFGSILINHLKNYINKGDIIYLYNDASVYINNEETQLGEYYFKQGFSKIGNHEYYIK